MVPAVQTVSTLSTVSNAPTVPMAPMILPIPATQTNVLHLHQSGTVDGAQVLPENQKAKVKVKGPGFRGSVVERPNGVLIVKAPYKEVPQTRRNPSIDSRRPPEEPKPFRRKALIASKSTPNANGSSNANATANINVHIQVSLRTKMNRVEWTNAIVPSAAVLCRPPQ